MNSPTCYVKVNGVQRIVTPEELQQMAALIGLDELAPGRFSWLLLLDLILWHEYQGHEPFQVARQIQALESGSGYTGTKPPTEFRFLPLKGLWHKHFFDAHFIAPNIANHLNNGHLKAIVGEVFDSTKSPVATHEMVAELTNRIVDGSLQDRDKSEKLTGEWIIFAKHEGQNYYLCLARHYEGDEAIYDRIKTMCHAQFPFLANIENGK